VKRWWWLILVGVVVLGLLGWAALPRLLAARTPAPEAQALVPVYAALPHRGPIERLLSVSGTLVATSTVSVTPKISGRIERILVEEGRSVAAGDLLVQIEDQAPALQVEQARAAWQAAEAQREKARQGIRPEELENARALYAKAQADLATAEESFARAEKLYKGGTIAKAQYEEADSALRSARTQVENAGRTLKMMEEGGSPEEQQMARSQAQAMEASYELARLQLDYTRIRAPASGVVARILKDEGNVVGTGTTILVLVQDDPIRVEVALPEKYYGEVLANTERIQARVSPIAYAGSAPFLGRIQSVAPTVSPGSRTFAVTLEIGNPGRLLRPGMYTPVELVLQTVPDALLVPMSALLRREAVEFVFVLRQDERGIIRASAREVRTGLESLEEVQIVSGLAEGERVVVEGNAFLEEGEPVRVVESPAAESP
jgi:HlyD family secretion protein